MEANKEVDSSKLLSPDDEIELLTKLVVGNKELNKLEKEISNFNIFKILRITNNEIRHSNVLSWFFNPKESHGLGDLFLRRWLMEILSGSVDGIKGFPNIITIDSMQFNIVKVRREYKIRDRFIDLIIEIKTEDEKKWLIVIENKIDSIQYVDQLSDYKSIINSEFSENKYNKLFVFLTKNKEKPKDTSYLEANYEQIFRILSNCKSEKENAIGSDALVFINHYLKILSEVCMDNSEVAILAKKIYETHKPAMDLIIKHKPDCLGDLSNILVDKLKNESKQNNIEYVGKNSKKEIVIIPVQWSTNNKSNGNWDIYIEINLWGNIPNCNIILNTITDKSLKVESLDLSLFPNIKRNSKKWIYLHFEQLMLEDYSLDELIDKQVDDCARDIYEAIIETLKSEDMKTKIGHIGEKLKIKQQTLKPIV